MPRVSGAYLDGTREFAQRRSRLVERLLGVAERLTGRLVNAMGARWEFARRFTEGIEKLTRNTSGDHQRKTVRLATGDFEGCRNTGVRSLSLVVMFDCNL
ncbi:hypothetical protein GW17_00061429 [Ensete ventricosum]|nr:hypothetical protein GW17_00061429 [Ensete ventricosum]